MVDIDLGYEFSAPRRLSEPGSPRLEINLFETPTKKHFDPVKVYLPIASEHGGIDYINIENPWPTSERLKLCAGKLDLIDNVGKHLDIFTFGGELSIQNQGTECLKVVIDSSAPILHTSLGHPAVTLLIEECEIILAQRRGAWEYKADEFEKRLVAAEPLSLYLACLQAVEERIRHIPNRGDETAAALTYLLHKEIRACQEILPAGREFVLASLL